MFKELFYNFLWFLTLTATAFNASEATRVLFEGTVNELIISLALFFISITTFVTIDRTMKKEGL
jgi:hypothetical protein